MKIKIELESVNPKYYDEILHFDFTCNKSNVHVSSGSFLKPRLVLMIITICYSVYAFFSIIFHSNIIDLIIHLVLFAFFSFYAVLFSKQYISAKMSIRERVKKGDNRVLIIDKEKIVIEKEKQVTYSVCWDSIKSVCIGKYSIVFIPKEKDISLIGIPIEYKDEIIEALDESGKKDLLVDSLVLEEQQKSMSHINRKGRIMKSIIFSVIFILIMGVAFLYVSNATPEVITVDDLIVTQDEKVSDVSFVEEVINGKIISKEKEIDTSNLGKKKVTIEVESFSGEKYEFEFEVEVVEKDKNESLVRK